MLNFGEKQSHIRLVFWRSDAQSNFTKQIHVYKSNIWQTYWPDETSGGEKEWIVGGSKWGNK